MGRKLQETFDHSKKYLSAYAEGTECSEMSVCKIQMLGNYPEESIQHSEHGKSLKSRKISILSFTADQVMTDDSEDNLQIGVFPLQTQQKSVGIYSITRKIKDHDICRARPIVDNKCLQHEKNFKCLGCELSCENGKDISTKASRFCSNTGNSKQFKINFGEGIFKNKSI